MFPATLDNPEQRNLLRQRLMRDLPGIFADPREAATAHRASFDTSILAAPVRPRMPNRNCAGRIRLWISAGAVVALLAVAAHIITADPLGRLHWDIAWTETVRAQQNESGK